MWGQKKKTEAQETDATKSRQEASATKKTTRTKKGGRKRHKNQLPADEVTTPEGVTSRKKAKKKSSRGSYGIGGKEGWCAGPEERGHPRSFKRGSYANKN